jgi:curved DNA-binding protein CbpA
VLGVAPDADAEAVQAAYVRLMRRVHPDTGGAPGLAAQLNAARDRLTS